MVSQEFQAWSKLSYVGCFQLQHKPRTIITWTATHLLTFLIETYLHILKTSHQSSRTDTFNVVTFC
ncbi:unnamed protein product, partial [Tenebrio molitor]